MRSTRLAFLLAAATLLAVACNTRPLAAPSAGPDSLDADPAPGLDGAVDDDFVEGCDDLGECGGGDATLPDEGDEADGDCDAEPDCGCDGDAGDDGDCGAEEPDCGCDDDGHDEEEDDGDCDSDSDDA
jgi:hypothetical protein